MEKEKFLFLVQNFTSLSEAEASELTALLSDYPYSQLIHHLATRAAQDNHLKIYNHQLHLSAIYSTDRTILKGLMNTPRGLPLSYSPARIPVPVTDIDDASRRSGSVPAIKQSTITISGDDLIHEIEFDLAKLKELKQNFELTLEEYDRMNPPAPASKKKKEKNDPSPEDGLIEEIKISKQPIDLEGEKQKEQNQIIEEFIKTSPTITRGKTKSPAEDFTENHSAFSDHIISETLVDILLKQGKKEKAIEVLRKLIWKFPQKKTIFAARIEELKK